MEGSASLVSPGAVDRALGGGLTLGPRLAPGRASPGGAGTRTPRRPRRAPAGGVSSRRGQAQDGRRTPPPRPIHGGPGGAGRAPTPRTDAARGPPRPAPAPPAPSRAPQGRGPAARAPAPRRPPLAPGAACSPAPGAPPPGPPLGGGPGGTGRRKAGRRTGGGRWGYGAARNALNAQSNDARPAPLVLPRLLARVQSVLSPTYAQATSGSVYALFRGCARLRRIKSSFIAR